VRQIFRGITNECIGFGELYQCIRDDEVDGDIRIRNALPHRVLMWWHNRELDDANDKMDEADYERWPLPDYWVLPVRHRVHRDNVIYDYVFPNGKTYGWRGA
jgi:hypothetical protein